MELLSMLIIVLRLATLVPPARWGIVLVFRIVLGPGTG
jgi:hypothetical protein